MRKKALATVKLSLLICTLTALGLGAAPRPAQADITIICDGLPEICLVLEDQVLLGDRWTVIIE